MLSLTLSEGLPSATVSTLPKATFWRDPVAFSVKPPKYPVPVPTSDGRPVPGSSGSPRPTKHLSGSALGTQIWWGLAMGGLIGGFLLWKRRTSLILGDPSTRPRRWIVHAVDATGFKLSHIYNNKEEAERAVTQRKKLRKWPGPYSRVWIQERQ